MTAPDVSRRHRAFMGELVSRWRHSAGLSPREPLVPFDDEDEAQDDRDRVVAEVLGALIPRLGKLDLSGCLGPSDVDRALAQSARAALADDPRPGAADAARIVFSLLTVPIPLPNPDSPAASPSA